MTPQPPVGPVDATVVPRYAGPVVDAGDIRGPLYAPSDLVDDRALGFAAVTCPEVEHDGLGGAVERIAYDHAQVTGIAAAHVGYELLSVMARTP